MKTLLVLVALFSGAGCFAPALVRAQEGSQPTNGERIRRAYDEYLRQNRGHLSSYAGLYSGTKSCGEYVEFIENFVYDPWSFWLYSFDDDTMTVFSIGNPKAKERIRLTFTQKLDLNADGKVRDKPVYVYKTSANKIVGSLVGFDGDYVSVGLELHQKKGGGVSTNKHFVLKRCPKDKEKKLIEAAIADNSQCGKLSGDADIAACSEAIRANPRHATAYYNRGNGYLAKDDNDSAIADYDKAIEFDPKLAVAYINRGAAYRSKGELDRAIADYGSAVKLDSKLSIAYGNRGRAYKAKGDLRLAVADFDKSIELDPKDADAYDLRAAVHEKLGDRAAAVADWTKEIALLPNPNTAVDFNSRAWAYFKIGKAAEGLPDIERSLELRPNDPDSLDTRGSIFEALGRREEAIADFRRALSKNPDLQSSKDALARLGARP